MPVIADPDGTTSSLLLKIAPLRGRRVLEIGCGRGRITFGYAEHTHHVTAIDPIEEDIRTAIQNTPTHLNQRIRFIESSIEEFIYPDESERFDIILFTFSL